MAPLPAICNGKVVFFNYTLRNDAGDLLESSAPGRPLPYLHGAGNIVPGLEREMDGHSVGDRFKVRVSPAEGYGERAGNGPIAIPRRAFPPDVEIEPGMPFIGEDEKGRQTVIWVVRADNEYVLVDTNHPLAGEFLNFEIEIVAIRDATEQEIANGYPLDRGDAFPP